MKNPLTMTGARRLSGVFSRRTFMSALAAGVTVSQSPSWLFADDRTTDQDANSLTLQSHHPGQIMEDPEGFIKKLCMPKPQGKKIADQIYGSSQMENVFLVDLGEHSVLFDTGFDHQVNHHLDNLEALGCNLSKVVAILASHSHVDHTGGLKKARERLDVPVVAHPLAIKPVSTGDPLQTAAVIPDVKGWNFDFPACPIDETVDHGDVIQIGGERIDVFHIPGHTPDSLAYLWNGHFFTGDAVFGGGLIGWAHVNWLSNYQDHADTMLRLIEAQPEADQFYCTHGPVLPWSPRVPEACIKTLGPLIARKDDPCTKTPRTALRATDAKTRTLSLPG